MLLCAATPQSALVGASTPPSRVAVVGGGLAGLATAFHLLNVSAPLDALHVYDAGAPGTGGASAAAAGLLHPFTRTGGEIWRGRDGFAATCALLRACEAHASAPFCTASGLLRLALDDESTTALESAASAAHVGDEMRQEWLSRDGAAASAGAALGGELGGAALAPAALSVNTPAYLRALWALCEAEAAAAGADCRWIERRLGSLAELQAAEAAPYDAIVVATGARVIELEELRGLRDLVTLCRGQNLLLENAGGLKTPLICGKYAVPVAAGAHVLAGATFEYDPPETVHRPADADAAAAALRPALARLHPALGSARVIGATAGVRALPPRSHRGYVPLCGRLALPPEAAPAGVWLFGALGSRGLIHHALLGRAVAAAVLAGDEAPLPEHTRRCEERVREALG